MGGFAVSRSTTVIADPARVHGLINSFHEWTAWSPWEDLDPELQRDYAGPESGVGARYAWSGNRKAGQGSMEITSSTPDEIRVRLAFLRPFKSTNQVTFSLTPAVDGTEVTWLMTGEQRGLMGLVGKVVPMDRFVGKDFEKGLTRLKAVAEAPA
ncbi:MAG: SRPBCC family protein [Nocardioides sp.]